MPIIQFVEFKARSAKSELPWPSRAIEVRIGSGCSLIVNTGFDAQHPRVPLAELDRK